MAFYYHHTYTYAFQHQYSSGANRTLDDAKVAFSGMFRTNFVNTSGIFINTAMSMDECSSGNYHHICDATCCGNSHSGHMKCNNRALDNFDFGDEKIFDQSRSYMGVLAYSATLCNEWPDGKHDSVGGAARTPGLISIVFLRPGERNHTRNVRKLQHELSHNFGLDYSVNCIALCIMSGGFDNTNVFEDIEIWCDNHANQFRRKHP